MHVLQQLVRRLLVCSAVEPFPQRREAGLWVKVLVPRPLWDEFRETVEPHRDAAPLPVLVQPLQEAIYAHARHAVHVAGGNQSRAADMLGISRQSLWRILRGKR